ncbi:hypothetical protein [Sutterella megalosphaeroides]|uniref:Uncharacterized protein n=1 Tax=Sutterella megalosphaeroides TaxID=2494234 RepID=A0A2Z6IEY1_9BURK|nr:hypothetical protein [Sutterella megalosphaeroides]BBF23316.1 hypothetical protein SUTMEG_12070 [Sutterella megalosphaeroides]
MFIDSPLARTDALGRRELPEGARFPEPVAAPRTRAAARRLASMVFRGHNLGILSAMVQGKFDRRVAVVNMAASDEDRRDRAVFETPEGELVGPWMSVYEFEHQFSKAGSPAELAAARPNFGYAFTSEFTLCEWRALTDNEELNLRLFSLGLVAFGKSDTAARFVTGSSRFSYFFELRPLGRSKKLSENPIPFGTRLYVDGIPVAEWRRVPQNAFIVSGITAAGEGIYWTDGHAIHGFTERALPTPPVSLFDYFRRELAPYFNEVLFRNAEGEALKLEPPLISVDEREAFWAEAFERDELAQDGGSPTLRNIAETAAAVLPSLASREFWKFLPPRRQDYEALPELIPEMHRRERAEVYGRDKAGVGADLFADVTALAPKKEEPKEELVKKEPLLGSDRQDYWSFRGTTPSTTPTAPAVSPAAPAPRKRGRPRKNPLPETAVAPAPAPATEEPPKRRRGRPSRAEMMSRMSEGHQPNRFADRGDGPLGSTRVEKPSSITPETLKATGASPCADPSDLSVASAPTWMAPPGTELPSVRKPDPKVEPKFELQVEAKPVVRHSAYSTDSEFGDAEYDVPEVVRNAMSAEAQPPGWLGPAPKDTFRSRRTVTTVEGNVSMTTFAGVKPRKKLTSTLSEAAAMAPKTPARATTAKTTRTRTTTTAKATKKKTS